MPRSPSAALVALFVLISGSAQAVPVTTSFTAIDFYPGSAPTNPVSGVIAWEAASLTAPIESLTSISLTIAGHTYGAGELTFISPPDDSTVIIGGWTWGAETVRAGTDDFWLMFDRLSATPRQFLYGSVSTPSSDFSTMSFASFTIADGGVADRAFAAADPVGPNAVSEPPTLALFAAGLAGLAFRRRRRPLTRAPLSVTPFA